MDIVTLKLAALAFIHLNPVPCGQCCSPSVVGYPCPFCEDTDSTLDNIEDDMSEFE